MAADGIAEFHEAYAVQACSVDYGHNVCHSPAYVEKHKPVQLIAVMAKHHQALISTRQGDSSLHAGQTPIVGDTKLPQWMTQNSHLHCLLCRSSWWLRRE